MLNLDSGGAGVRLTAALFHSIFPVMSMLFIVKVDLQPNSVTLLNVLFGALIPAFDRVCNYWLGSSAGSNDKSAQIAAPTLVWSQMSLSLILIQRRARAIPDHTAGVARS